MEAFTVSAGITALAEIGDKTQLLALMLAAQFRKPLTIMLGILAATVVNHAFAGAVGASLTQAIGPEPMRWLLGCSFIAIAGWALLPDKAPADGEAAHSGRTCWTVFAATAAAFFWLEMGDKTQIATVALAAQYAMPAAVVAGTTAGMLLANLPGVCLGARISGTRAIGIIRVLAAAGFALIGIAVLVFGG